MKIYDFHSYFFAELRYGMMDKSLEVLEQYELTVNRTFKGRGALILDTDKGYKKLIEYNGTDNRVRYEHRLLEYIKNKGFDNVDDIVSTKEDELIAADGTGQRYIVRDCFYGRECNVNNEQDVYVGAEILACLHNILYRVEDEKIKEIAMPTDKIVSEYNKHNNELKRIRNYMRAKKHKVEFEYDILNHFDEYYDYACRAMDMMLHSPCEAMENEAVHNNEICHGSYNYHNIIFIGNKTAVTGFERSGAGLVIKDLYLYLRKIMEKHNWDIKVGHNILEKYDKVRTISARENQVLKVMLKYPEKFWKVVNHYYNSNKSWIPDKNVEKLKIVYRQQMQKEEFICKIWSN